jgi:glycosyltransferase involved in cell wall biosynthesis
MNNKPIKILFVHSSSEMYGSDRCLYELIKGINKKQFIPVVVLPFEGELAERLKALGVTVYITDPWVLRKGIFHSINFIPYLFKLPVSIFRLIRIIKRERISVVYSNTSVILGSALSSYIMRKPHIYHIRELYDNYPVIAIFYRRLLCFFSRKLIAISKAVESLLSGTCPGKIEMVYDGIVLDRFSKVELKMPDEISEWKQQNHLVISNIGRVSPIKGQDIFIDAIAESTKQNTDMRFLIIGDVFKGNEHFMHYLKNKVDIYSIKDFIVFTGFREDIDAFIVHSDIIVVSTIITEGLGQVVMEGMAAGKVVIAPNKGGPAELIEHEVNGILYSAGNPNALAQAILKVATDPALRKSIGEKARKKAEEKFGIQNNIQAIEKIINDVANMKKRSKK